MALKYDIIYITQ